MTSSYLPNGLPRETAHTVARAEKQNEIAALIEAAFALLPDLNALVASNIYTGPETGVADAYILSGIDGAPTAVTTLVHASFIPTNTNVGTSPTLDFNGWGARPIRGSDGSSLVAGALVAGQAYTTVFNGTYWSLLGQAGGGLSSAQLLALINALQQPTIENGGFYWAEQSGPWVNASGSAQQVPTSTPATAMTALGFRRPFAAEYSGG